MRRFELSACGRLINAAKAGRTTSFSYLVVAVKLGGFFMVELKNLFKNYPTSNGVHHVALSNINLKVNPGEIHGIIGKSGAGKSTLVRCVNLLERPTSGSVCVAGQDLTQLSLSDLKQARRQIGMVFQHFNLLSRRTVAQNIALPLELIGKSRTEIASIINPLIELTELGNRRDAFPHQLSGGQKQRVAIARALATSPKVLLCDEMTSSLDPETTFKILQLVKSINKQLNLSVLLITHEMEVIKNIADRVSVLENGSISEESDVYDLFTHPQSQAVHSFVNATAAMHLPDVLQQRISQQPPPGEDYNLVWRLIFAGEPAQQPVLAQLLKNIPMELNILQANLEFIQGKSLGMMVVAVHGSSLILNQAKTFLLEKLINVEEIGYVARDVELIHYS